MTLIRCTFRVSPEIVDALSSCLFEAGIQGLEESLAGDTLTTYVESAVEVEALRATYEDFRERVRAISSDFELEEIEIEATDRSWEKTWLNALEPFAVTDRYVLRPTTRAPAPAGEETLWFEPSPSFGSGSHATTRLAALALERLAEKNLGQSFFDVGTGNGVLALVGLRAGFDRVLGVDISSTAVEALRENAKLNGLSGQVRAELGSADSTEESFPVVVANIDTPTLLTIASALTARVAEGGTLLLTGLLDEDAPAILESYRAPPFELSERHSQNGWTLLELKRASS